MWYNRDIPYVGVTMQQVTLYTISEYLDRFKMIKSNLMRDCVDSRGAPALPHVTIYRLDRHRTGMIGVDADGNPVLLITKSKQIRIKPSQR